MYAQVTQFTKMLHTLSRLLDKAHAHAKANGFEPEVLLSARLAPDMLPLTSQVQWVCDTASLATSVLAGKQPPVAANTERTIPELKARIDKTIGHISLIEESEFSGWEDRIVNPAGWSGAFRGEDYFYQHAVPNFYFHMVTAYVILRHKGVKIGKLDYIGQLPFLR